MSIGILTSGGDAPGMNAAVRAAFRCLKMRDPDCEIVIFRDGFRGLARRLDSSSDRNVDRRAVRDIIHRGGTFIGTGRVPELLLPPADDPSYAERLKELKVSARCIPIADNDELGDCIFTGRPGQRRVIFARAY